MPIKEEIGKRILAERKARNLTRKALAELTDGLNQSRINNWERGYRTPGPEEIKQLAKALDVSAAYLMCLADDKNSHKSKEIPGVSAVIPVLKGKHILDTVKTINSIKLSSSDERFSFIASNEIYTGQLSKYSFAFKIQDESMKPILLPDDLVVIDPDVMVNPGDMVLALKKDSDLVVVRMFRQLTESDNMVDFELLSENENWPDIKSSQSKNYSLIGTVITIIRRVKK